MGLKVDTIQNPTSATVNLTLDTSGNVTAGGNLTVSGTGNQSFGGNVGIGTTSPQVRLQIGSSSTSTQSENIDMWGALAGSNGDIGRLRFYNANAFGNKIVAQVSGAREGNNYGGALVFSTGTQADTTLTERMRVDSTGRLIVGATTVSYTTASINAVASSGSGAYLQTNYASDVANPALWISKFDNNSTTSQIFVKFNINANGAGSGQINANGASAAAFGTYSDSRLKENIADLPPQLDNIVALRPVEFDYVKSEGGGHQIGFIAQEMQEVYPDVVGEREDGMLTVTGWSKTEARLVKALQEAIFKINALENRIAALEAK